MSHDISRRTFLKLLGGGLAGAAAGGALVKREDILAFLDADKAAGAAGTDLGKVTTRYYKPLGKDLSLLGFGCMRLPTTFTASGREIDKELGEKMVDFAIATASIILIRPGSTTTGSPKPSSARPCRNIPATQSIWPTRCRRPS